MLSAAEDIVLSWGGGGIGGGCRGLLWLQRSFVLTLLFTLFVHTAACRAGAPQWKMRTVLSSTLMARDLLSLESMTVRTATPAPLPGSLLVVLALGFWLCFGA